MVGRPAEEFWEGYHKLRPVRAILGMEGRLTLRTDGSWQLNLDPMWLPDLKILSGTLITRLQCGDTAITDLAPLRGLALRSLNSDDGAPCGRHAGLARRIRFVILAP